MSFYVFSADVKGKLLPIDRVLRTRKIDARLENITYHQGEAVLPAKLELSQQLFGDFSHTKSGVLVFDHQQDKAFFGNRLDSSPLLITEGTRCVFPIIEGQGKWSRITGTLTLEEDAQLESDQEYSARLTVSMVSYQYSGTELEKRILVKDILDEKAFPITTDATMEYAADVFALTNAHELMVINNEGEFIGVISEYDLLRSLLPDTQELLSRSGSLSDAINSFMRTGRNVSTQTIKRLIKAHPITVSSWDELLSVATIMSQTKIRRLPVVDHGRFLGSISMSDVCWALLSKWNGIKQEQNHHEVY